MVNWRIAHIVTASGFGPFQAVVSPDSSVVAMSAPTPGDQSIFIIDTTTWAVIHTITFPGTETVEDLAFSPDGAWLAASNPPGGFTGNTVSIIDTSTWTVAHVVTTHFSPHGLVWAHDGSFLAVGTGSSTQALVIIDTATWTVIHDVPSPGDLIVRLLAITPDDATIIASLEVGVGAIEIWTFDTATWTWTSNILSPASCLSLTVSPDGSYLAVAEANDGFQTLDTATWAVLDTVVGIEAYGMDISSDGLFFVAASGAATPLVTIGDPAGWTPTQTVAMPAEVALPQIAPNRKFIVVLSPPPNDLIILEPGEGIYVWKCF